MSIVLKQEIERLEKLITTMRQGSDEYLQAQLDLEKVKKDLSTYKPSGGEHNVCISCEG